MYVVLIGPQGSGKGTQADRLAPKHGLMKIATGDLFRAERSTGSELGRQLGAILDAGNFVPDDITVAVVDRRLAEIDAGAAKGAVFDGFPRNRQQALELDAALAARGEAIDIVIEIAVHEEMLVERLGGRRVCTSCGKTFHIVYNPPVAEGLCDRCGGRLEQRADDTPEAIHRRLSLYRELTAPVLEYYADRGLVRTVNGDQTMDAVEHDIANAIPVGPGENVE